MATTHHHQSLSVTHSMVKQLRGLKRGVSSALPRAIHWRPVTTAAMDPAKSVAGTSASGSAKSREVVSVLGGQDFLYSQMNGVSEELFRGDRLGVDADIATGDMRQSEMRSLAHLPDGFVPPERFLGRVALHLAKNALVGQGRISTSQVPLIMGIWGHKGSGKSFNLELCCKIMGVQPIIISAGEIGEGV